MTVCRTSTGAKQGAGYFPLRSMQAEEVAELLGVTVADLDLWRSQGRGPTRRTDGTFVRWEVHTWAHHHGRHRRTDSAGELRELLGLTERAA